MTDKKDTKNNDAPSDAANTQASSDSVTISEKNKSAAAIPEKSSSKVKTSQTNNTPKTTKSWLSILALLLAFVAIAGSVGLFYWQKQQETVLVNNLLQRSSEQSSAAIAKVQQLLAEQQKYMNTQVAKHSDTLSSVANKISQSAEKERLALQVQVDRLAQKQPSDWLLHEVEYLIRIAARTIWLEKDTQAAINLLQDAEQRIQELNDPHYLPLRQVINDDIEALKLLPKLATQKVVLTLISLNKQITKLPLAMAKVPQKTEADENFELTNDTSDWKSNLAKTWQKFLKDFITINRRSGAVEPLLSPQYQQNLRENLSLKLQLAQWATIQENSEVYLASLDDIQAWLNEYFDMAVPQNNLFMKEITALKNALISYQYPNSLTSLKAIRDLLKQKNIQHNTPSTPKKEDNIEEPLPVKAEPSSESLEGA